MRVFRLGAICACLLAIGGCNPFGPSCTERQQRGDVTTIRGTVAAGQTMSHRVAYGSQGSQNDLDITWIGQGTTTRLRVDATGTECVDFVPPGSGPCAPVGSRGGTSVSGTDNDFVQRSITIASGRGNPNILGTPPEYLLWVMGDPVRSVDYTIRITWFYGPDC